jgi:hypothetical protein
VFLEKSKTPSVEGSHPDWEKFIKLSLYSLFYIVVGLFIKLLVLGYFLAYLYGKVIGFP